MAIDWKPEYVIRIAKQMMMPRKVQPQPEVDNLIKRVEEINGRQTPPIK